MTTGARVANFALSGNLYNGSLIIDFRVRVRHFHFMFGYVFKFDSDLLGHRLTFILKVTESHWRVFPSLFGCARLGSRMDL